MVFILDEGSEFKAPLSKVWELAQSEGKHNHPSQIDPQTSMQNGVPVLSYGSRTADGSVVRSSIKVTMLPPVGFVLEYIDGPMEGTKLMQYYTPKGDKTKVTVVGDAVSKTMTEGQLRKAVLKGLDTAFKEDEENLRRM